MRVVLVLIEEGKAQKEKFACEFSTADILVRP
jgi:hypothetical protein